MSLSDVAVPAAPKSVATRVNDFSIQVATVNGSGSQTANLVLLRSLFQMGVPVSGKNMFPSNIAGLPTWYTIRANKHGYIARKKEVDFLVAMNPETAREDVLSLEPGTAVLYDEPLKLSGLRAGPDLLPGALRQDRGRGLQGRQAAPPRQEHDLRRRALEAAQHRFEADGARAEASAWEEAEGHRVEHGRARGRLRLRRAAPAQASIRTGSSRWTRRPG